jgi:hypothetical protein
MATDVVQEASEALAKSKSSRHLLHHAKDHEDDDSSEGAVAREQPRESSYFEALQEPRGVGGRSLLSIKTPCLLCTIFNIQYFQYFQY